MAVARNLRRGDAPAEEVIWETVRRQVDAFECDFGNPESKLTNLISNLKQILERHDPRHPIPNRPVSTTIVNNNTNWTRSQAIPLPPPNGLSNSATTACVVQSLPGPGRGNQRVLRYHSVAPIESEPEEQVNSDLDDDENDDTDGMTLHIPAEFQTRLEQDYTLIKGHDELIQLPVSPNSSIVDILEDYIKHFGLKCLLEWWDELDRWNFGAITNSTTPFDTQIRSSKRTKRSSSSSKPESTSDGSVESGSVKQVNPRHQITTIRERVEKTKKEIDDLRILFDFLAQHCLLYNEEQASSKRMKVTQIEYYEKENCYYYSSGSRYLKPLIVRCTKEFGQEVPPPLPKINLPEPTVQISKRRFTRFSSTMPAAVPTNLPGVVPSNLPVAVPTNLPIAATTCQDLVLQLPAPVSNLPLPMSYLPMAVPTTSQEMVLRPSIGQHIGNKRTTGPPPSQSQEIEDMKKEARQFVHELLQWRLLPRTEYALVPPHPTLVYGLVHLMRMLVKLPTILTDMEMKPDDIQTTLKNINGIIMFITKYNNYFSEHITYVTKPAAEGIRVSQRIPVLRRDLLPN